MTPPSPSLPLETKEEGATSPKMVLFGRLSSVIIHKAFFASCVLWAFAVACFFMLRFSLLPFMEGARGWLDSLP